MLGDIADILGIISFFVSVFTFAFTRLIFNNIKEQRKEYNDERFQIQTSLMGLRVNIWEDSLLTINVRSSLRTHLLTYRQKYWKLSSPGCFIQIQKSLLYIRSEKTSTRKKESLCASIDYIIARLNIKEDEL